MLSIYLATLGCEKNRVDSEIMLSCLIRSKFTYEANANNAAIIIVNTCGFLQSAVEESIEQILELAKYKKEGKCECLVVVGCLVARYKEKLMEEVPEIDVLLGTSDYKKIVPVIQQFLTTKQKVTSIKEKPLYVNHDSNAPRILSTQPHFAFVKIAEGCSNVCSFCNIPKLRGPLQSRLQNSIVQEIQSLLARGVKEINLVAQDSSAYGQDLEEKTNLAILIESILTACPNDFWLRTFYSYPNTYPLATLDLMNADSRLVPYIDMPFQHISNTVLAKMNRNLHSQDIYTLLEKIKTKLPSASIRSSFIVGFSNETQKDFEELCHFIEQGFFAHVGIFTYSAEDNIVSNRWGDPISLEEKEERKATLLAIQQEVSLKRNQQYIGTKQKVLIEQVSEETDLLLQARASFHAPFVDGNVLINEGTATAGTFEEVLITQAHAYDLIGQINNL